jgi:hypothetical protein
MANVEATNSENKVTVRLNGDNADITAGGNGTGQSGALLLKNSQGHTIVGLGSIRVSGGPVHPSLEINKLELTNRGGEKTFGVLAESADVEIGGGETDGTLKLRNSANDVKIHMDAKDGIELSGESSTKIAGGSIMLSASGQQRVFATALGMVVVGGDGSDGRISILPSKAVPASPLGDSPKRTIELVGESGEVLLSSDGKPRIHLDGKDAEAWVGGHGLGGQIGIFASGATANDDPAKATIHIKADNGETAIIRVGGNTKHGEFRMLDKDNNNTIELDAQNGNLRVGGGDQDGTILLRDKEENVRIRLEAETGDIILQNADCAEDFDIAESGAIEPGTVMVLDHDGKLQQSTEAYDKKVAGVISGAGDFKPGIVLDKKQSENNRLPVALMGKVYCKADAQYSSIEVGDLLTTSKTPGHAMKAMEPFKAFGSVIGKALRPLKNGQGLIPILIALQ